LGFEERGLHFGNEKKSSEEERRFSSVRRSEDIKKIMKISALTTAMKKHLELLPKMHLLFQMTPKEAHPLRVNLITNPIKQSNHWMILQWDLNELNLYENERVSHN
jgi:hypothetical protein